MFRQNSSSLARQLSCLAGAVALSALSFSAFAGEAAAVHKTVRYDDLNLSRSSDAAQLYERLGNAAEAVCSHYAGVDLLSRKLRRQCETEALSNAVSELNNPAITALHTADERVRVAQGRTSAPKRS